MVQVAVEGGVFSDEVSNVRSLASALGDVQSLTSKADNLDVSGVERIYKLLDLTSKIMQSLGTLVEHDAGEFEQVSANMHSLDAQAAGK